MARTLSRSHLSRSSLGSRCFGGGVSMRFCCTSGRPGVVKKAKPPVEAAPPKPTMTFSPEPSGILCGECGKLKATRRVAWDGKFVGRICEQVACEWKAIEDGSSWRPRVPAPARKPQPAVSAPTASREDTERAAAGRFVREGRRPMRPGSVVQPSSRATTPAPAAGIDSSRIKAGVRGYMDASKRCVCGGHAFYDISLDGVLIGQACWDSACHRKLATQHEAGSSVPTAAATPAVADRWFTKPLSARSSGLKCAVCGALAHYELLRNDRPVGLLCWLDICETTLKESIASNKPQAVSTASVQPAPVDMRHSVGTAGLCNFCGRRHWLDMSFYAPNGELLGTSCIEPACVANAKARARLGESWTQKQPAASGGGGPH